MRRRIMVGLVIKSSSAKRIEAQNDTSSHLVAGCDD
jgi:hypothetical protein